MSNGEKALINAWSDHSRMWENNTWVYPVISRRAEGLSLGINLNPDHHCSFSCVYCQSGPQENHQSIPIDVYAIEKELREFLAFYNSPAFYKNSFFGDIPPEKKVLKDICLSGDGESTIVKEFSDVCRCMREIQKEFKNKLGSFKLRLITNGSRLNSSSVQEGLNALVEENGEIWAKLDAGTNEWYQKINRSKVKFETILQNLESAIKIYPLCVQTMLCNIQGEIPTENEINSYIEHLKHLYSVQSKNFLEVQLYTVIRQTVLSDVTALSKEFLKSVATKIKNEIPIKVRIF